jgi:hypothetical protein
MHKARLFAVATAFLIAGAALWIAPTTHAQAPVSAERINPSQLAMNATKLAVERFDDLSFVF